MTTRFTDWLTRKEFNYAHEVVDAVDQGEDLDGKGVGWRKVEVHLYHVHNERTFLTTHDIAIPSGTEAFEFNWNCDVD